MNKISIFLFTLFISVIDLVAQTPDKMSYQAVIRSADNSLVIEASVGIKILIRKASATGNIVFEETHQALTNKNGLASLIIGTGSETGGSFSTIDWSQGPYFIETQIDLNGGSNYSITGVSEILSVPYAIQAKKAMTLTGTISESQISDLDHYSDLDINGEEAAFSGWDKNVNDDFSGDYRDLVHVPYLYTVAQVDSIFDAKRVQAKDYMQSLNLQEKILNISGGNSISFESWDSDDSDDFSGDYNALFNTPQIYTKSQVDSIKNSLLGNIDSFYIKKPQVTIISSPRELDPGDIGNTIVCSNSSVLTITKDFEEMKVGDAINLEVHGITLTIKGASGVSINGVDSGEENIGNDEAYTGGILRKTEANSYIVL
ncbi:hypothetical protein [Flavimarina sp. Hel_I_48]|uniref:hypothetical protein n=1 Tax=Flavimarina sp. Hel_I_48 TaxID=1392488 RepID=UPI00068DE32E|nr:hypothetical protein [Flavimarina sp. Hel_I_48]